jgi:hypothetical protein
MSALSVPYTPESDEPHCPVCGEVADWILCPDCSGIVEATVYVTPEVMPATMAALGEMMRLAKKQFCDRCKGDGGWFRCSLGSNK